MNTSSFSIYKNSLCNTTNGTVNDSANEVVDSEIWKDIEGYEGLYQVSNLGRVKSLGNNKKRKDKILKPITLKTGYLQVDLCKDGKRKLYYIHRLVAQAFVPNDNPEHKTEANHINEIKTDCRASNINWLDHKRNINWGTRNERVGQKLVNHLDTSKPVKQLTLDGVLVTIWPSIMEASRNGFNQGNICLCCNGRQNTHKGFKWAYLK